METAWHAQKAQSVLEALRVKEKTGLSGFEIKDRREVYGANLLKNAKGNSLLKITISQLANPIVLVLIFAFVATLFLGAHIDALVILIALLINLVIGVVQERRADRAFEAIKENEKHFAIVKRDGVYTRVPFGEVVVGEIIKLVSGDMIAADARVLNGSEISTNEASLTGEWVPSIKEACVLPEHTSIAFRKNMVYAGSTVVSGEGEAVVVSVGNSTEIGKIADELGSYKKAETPLIRNISSIARTILFAVAILMATIFIFGIINGESVKTMFLTAVALAVAAVPEGLPAAVTVSLALGVERILKIGGVVKNLVSAEGLGTTTYILTDKTGTITKGVMSLSKISNRGGEYSPGDVEVMSTLASAILAGDATLEEKPDGTLVADGRPIEKGILNAGIENGITKKTLSQYEEVERISFSSKKRYGGALVRSIDSGEEIAFFMGAPEVLLASATHYTSGMKEKKMSSEDRMYFENKIKEYGVAGYRVLGVSHKVSKDKNKSPTDTSFAGLLVFSDYVRDGVKESIAEMRRAGAKVLMITGDNPNTALAVAGEVGLCGADDGAFVCSSEDAVSGDFIAELSDAELLQELQNKAVFARVLPLQKLRIVNVLTDAGEVVAMTGDGINDAPALKRASIGMAVESGTEVAKESADMILKDASFSVITKAIEEGRRLRDNIRKVVAYLLATSASGTFIIAGALLAALPLPVLPVQILWSNMVGGGLMNFAFAFEPLDNASMKISPKSEASQKIFSKDIMKLILSVALVTGIGLFVLYLVLLRLEVPMEEVRTIMFVGLSFDAIFFAFSMKSLYTPLYKLDFFSNRFLFLSVGVSVSVLLISLSVKPIAELLHLVEISAAGVMFLFMFALLNVLTIELAKAIFFKKPA